MKLMAIGDSKIRRQMDDASTYEEWAAAAREYDQYHGFDKWRRKLESRQYDYAVIKFRLDELRQLLDAGDTPGLLYALNEGIHGNLGGMGKASLYAHAKSGTKLLIEEFIDAIATALDLIAEDESGDISAHEKLDFFERASHCFGQTALMLSASGTLFFFHLGVARAMLAAGVMPTVLSGSSGGSIAGAMLCSHTDEELIKVLEPDDILARITKHKKGSKVPREERLQVFLDEFVPDLTFQQANELSGRNLSVSVAPAEAHQTSRLLNETTSPAVLLHSGVRASCAVPGYFPPVALEALDRSGKRKDYLPSRVFVDGGISDNLPAKRLARLYGVNHFIVSQATPHVIPFVADGQKKKNLFGVVKEAGGVSARAWFNAVSQLSEATPFMPDKVVRTSKLMRALVNQDYSGDIDIIADSRQMNLFKLLDYPGDKQVRALMENGEKSTWPKLEMIKQQTRISRKMSAIRAAKEDHWQAQHLASIA